MVTIKQEIQLTDKCLMGGGEASVKLAPSRVKGIFFYPNNSDNPIEADVNRVISTANCTILGKNNAQIKLVEHFMAACAIVGIDSLNIYVDIDEMPILDGSAFEWIKLFNDNGICDKKAPNSFQIKDPLNFSTDKSILIMFPADELSISYCVDFDHPDLSNRWYKWDKTKGTNEIAEARTFGYLKDLERFQEMGFALGADINNTVGLTDSDYTTPLRSDFEPIKHKILDLIGDLYLSGYNPLDIKAHIIACEAGHTAHVKLAKIFKKHMESVL